MLLGIALWSIELRKVLRRWEAPVKGVKNVVNGAAKGPFRTAQILDYKSVSYDFEY
jgi:hypothetical protein